jgi:hypothetical protein
MTQMAVGKTEKFVILLKIAQLAEGNAENGDIIKNVTNGGRKSGKVILLK